MKLRSFIAALHAALLCILLAASPAGSGSMMLMGVGQVGSAAANLTSLDGSSNSSPTTGFTTYTINLTTVHTNDAIIACLQYNAGLINSVSSASAGSFTKRGASVGTMDTWFVEAASILSSDTITITTNSDPGFLSIVIFAINGAPSSSFFDSNGALPATTTSSTPVSLTTSNANDFLYACYSTSGTQSAGAGWTSISANNFMLAQYKIVTTTQSGLSSPMGSGTIVNGIGDAVKSN